jgi:hypothetical protein
MQENIRNYKRLEADTETLSKRVEELRKIKEVYDTWKSQEDSFLTQKYIYHRSDLQIKNKQLELSIIIIHIVFH